MRSASMKHMVELARQGNGPISKLVGGAVEVGIIVPSVLRKVLKDAGYKVTYKVGPEEDDKEGKGKHGAWVRVTHDKKLVARAFSGARDESGKRLPDDDENEALLQALYAEMKVEAESKKEKSKK